MVYMGTERPEPRADNVMSQFKVYTSTMKQTCIFRQKSDCGLKTYSMWLHPHPQYNQTPADTLGGGESAWDIARRPLNAGVSITAVDWTGRLWLTSHQIRSAEDSVPFWSAPRTTTATEGLTHTRRAAIGPSRAFNRPMWLLCLLSACGDALLCTAAVLRQAIYY